ncbi:MAG TPA: hypothetical protein VH621_03005 [Nitrososphaera sp.]|jgi:hypothetical protein
MGLTSADRKELESLIKAAAQDPKIPVGLARKMMPSQGDIEDFAYGLVSGMVIGNFTLLFENRNGRELDRDEMADLFSVVMARMPRLRMSIMKHLALR